ncbi:hypothetical protein ACIHCQ_25590 [Streptomyces sp. NPDC052236]|uniref:hypothetical protein n=1 Tax=Streptomyces sp. NPDC052236 TaxID=3365686 RepID=UPI0037D3D4CA
MPRPTAAQLAFGSATVVFSTLALLLLTGTTNGVAVAAIAVSGMALGLVVAVALPMGAKKRTASAGSISNFTGRGSMPAPTPRATTGADSRIGEHSLRR